MAEVEQSIKLIFGAVDNTQTVISKIDRNIQTLGGNISSASEPLANITDLVIKADIAIAGFAATLISFSVYAAVEAEAAWAELQKVIGDDLLDDNARQQIKDLASDMGEFGSATTLSVAEFKQSGFDLRDSIGLTRASLEAVIATELDLESATGILKATLSGVGGSLEGFSGPVDSANHILQTWNALANNANTKVGDLGEAFKQLAPLMETAGFDFGTLSGIAATVIEVFQDGGESARGLKSAFLNLADPTARALQAFNDLGVTTKDANGNLKSSKELLFEVAKNWNTLGEEEQNVAASRIAGKDQFSKFNLLMQQFTRSTELQSIALGDNAKTWNEEVSIAMEGAKFKIQSLKASFAGLGVAIGDEFLDSTKDSIDAITNLNKAFTGIITGGGLEPLFDSINPLMEKFANDIQTIADILPDAFEGIDYTAITQGLESLGDAFGGVFDGIDLTTVEGLHDAIQITVDVIGNLIETTGGIVESFGPFIKTIGKLIQSFAEMDKETLNSSGNILGIGKQIDLLVPAVEGLSTALYGVSAALLTVFGRGAITAIGGVSGAIATVTTATGFALAAMQSFGLALVGLASFKVAPSLIDLLDKLGLSPFGDFEETKLKLSDLFTTIDEYFSDDKELVVNPAPYNETNWPVFFDGIKNDGAEVADQIKEELDDISKTIDVDWAKSMWDDSLVALEQIDDGVEVVKDGLQGIEVGGQRFVKTWEDGIPTFTAVGKKIDDIKKTTDEATKQTEAYHLKLLEIASDERIAGKEIAIEFDIAKLESQTNIVLASFSSIDNAINSTGNLIASLFGGIDDASLRTRFALEKQIDLESKWRGQQFDLQKDLIQAQIDLLKAKSKRYVDGIDIRVNADGLEPHLNAIMRYLFAASQVQANEEGAEFLIGCNA